jgi:hypothetical protein
MRADRMYAVSTWEYAEIAWRPLLGRPLAYWGGPDGHRTLKMHGMVAVNRSVRDGWEVVEYKTAEHWSSCLLRRPPKNADGQS